MTDRETINTCCECGTDDIDGYSTFCDDCKSHGIFCPICEDYIDLEVEYPILEMVGHFKLYHKNIRIIKDWSEFE